MKFIDLFAGLGGFHVGLKNAGHECVFACEIDEELAKPLKECVLGLIQDIIFSSRGGFTAVNLRSQYSRHEGISSSEEQQKNPGLLGLGGK